jgi:hypothetical protein
MRKTLLLLLSGILFISCKDQNSTKNNLISEKEEEHDRYDGPLERSLLEFDMTRDPALNIVPTERLWNALFYTETMQQSIQSRSNDLVWTERGPIYDSVGPSNGNGRGGPGGITLPGTITSGRIRAVLVDSTDPSGNTVFVGGVSGGLWKTINFLDPTPSWYNINDFFDNLAISSICQDPNNPNTMYFGTGEPTSNADAVFGKGVWKSTDHGTTWNLLPGSGTFNRIFKIICDKSGNVYIAVRGGGIRRSTNGGTSWTNITPNGISSTSHCSDIEISTTGTLHMSIGFYTSTGSLATYHYTNTPAAVTPTTWSTGTGLPTVANRIEITTLGNVVYLMPTNTSNNVYAAYLSTDGGQTFERRNTADYTASLTSSQGWYNLSLDVNPYNAGDFIVGGLDAYRSLDSGATIIKITSWATTPPYVHADHHYVKYGRASKETRILMASDGGIFFSTTNGLTFIDKNRGIGIKQFYSIAMHPTDPNYFLMGAQDNGTHQIKTPGLTYSIEVTGGDGAYTAIDQDEPQFQFGAYVYNNYRRSLNGGKSWSSINIGSNGLFINPFEYDNVNNMLFGCFGNRDAPASKMLRWNNPTTATSITSSLFDTIDINLLKKGIIESNATAFKVSPHTPNRLFVGGHNGSLVRIDDANTVTTDNVDSKTTVLTGSAFPGGYINCVAIGSTDDHLLAVMTNYGINNLWYSSDGGVNWSAIDGDLPDMPVRWALFDPVNNDKLVIATEAGVYVTLDVNGSSTKWVPSAGFPLVKTTMLKYRASDNTIAASTYGRGLWTANIATLLPIRNVTLSGNLQADGKSLIQWKTIDETKATRYIIQYSTDGVAFNKIAEVAYNVKQFSHNFSAAVGYYRIVATESNQSPVISNTISIRSNKVLKGLQLSILPNPITTSGSFVISNSSIGNYIWSLSDLQGRTLQTGKGSISSGESKNIPLTVSSLSPGMYRLKVVQNKEVEIRSFIKQ